MRLPLAITALVAATALAPAQEWVSLEGPFAAGRGAAYDALRNRLVVLGAEGGTWEYEAATRLHRATPVAPSPRINHAMVYDVFARHALLFGGRLGNQTLGDTWLWDGSTWRQQTGGVSPPARGDAGIAYDLWRQRVVMFGGQVYYQGVLSDTWEHDGDRWIQRSPATTPTPINQPLLAFDLVNGVTNMVTSPGITGWNLAIWEWNGTDWRERIAAAAPNPTGPTLPTQRFNSSLTYDPGRGRTVMFGGSSSGNELWEWDGNTWQLMLTGASATPINPAVFYDVFRGSVVILGGQDQTRGGWQTSAFSWDGTTFQNLWPNHSPVQRYSYTLVHDPVRNRAMIFGGGGFFLRDDTWEWNGDRWTERTPATSPSARQDGIGSFDPLTGSSLMFGGFASGTNLQDFWRWDGTNWTQIIPATLPPARSDGAMTWDGARTETILFGGYASGTWFNDTWRWDGVNWTRLLPATAPSPRFRHAMAFDPVRWRVVVFGGAAGGFAAVNYLSDTWEWNGTTWQRINPPVSPPALLGAVMTYDPVQARMLVVGFRVVAQSLFDLETWAYDGVTWARVASTPDALGGTLGLYWDYQRMRPVLISDHSVREFTSVPADATPYGTGCGQTVPVLAARARPRTGEGEFGLEALARPTQPVLFGLGTGQGSVPMGNGCTLLMQQVLATNLAVTNTSGLAILRFPLPQNHALRGLVLYGQAIVLDPLAPGGLAWTQGLRLTIGD